MFLHWITRYHAEDDGQPQGGEPGGDGKQRPTDVLDRFGRDALKLAEKLAEALSDNYTLREQRRTLRQEVTDLKSKAPADGAVVLSAADAALLDSYRALGAPDAIKQGLDGAATVTTELATLKRGESIRAAAEAHGYKPGALAKLPSLAGQEITLKDVKSDDGKATVKRAFVGEKSLPDYIQANDAEFLPALTAEPPKVGDGVGSPANGKRPAQGATLLLQPKATI